VPEFVLFATLTRLIGEAKPAGRATIAGDIEVLLFNGSNDESTIVLWDARAGDRSRSVDLQIGDASRQYDIWGRARPLAAVPDGRKTIRVGSSPTIIPGVPTWLIEFQTSLAVRPDVIGLNIAGQRTWVEFYNPHELSISGTLRLTPPPGWEVEPHTIRFSLAPAERVREPIRLTMQRGASAGRTRLMGSAEVLADRKYVFEIPLPFEVNTNDLDAWGLAFVAGDQLIVRHGIINRTSETLNIKGYVAAPGRMRQYRTVSSFKPGASTTLEYVLPNAASLRGRTLRLHLGEVNGSRFHNIDVHVN